MDIEFPIEFIVMGTPVSAQSQNPLARKRWKDSVREACRPRLPEQHRASDARLAATLFYFPSAPMQGDVDNIVKLTLDALSRFLYFDDSQIERVVVQKFESGRVQAFGNTTEMLLEALEGERPALYVRITDDFGEELL